MIKFRRAEDIDADLEACKLGYASFATFLHSAEMSDQVLVLYEGTPKDTSVNDQSADGAANVVSK